jgi:putative restriction endonuclease
LLVVCGLYFTLPFGRMHARNPDVIQVARMLDRTPSSVAMKLVNFASLDPAQASRGVRGLSGASRSDAAVWADFRDDWEGMTLRSEKKLRELEAATLASSPVAAPIVTERETESVGGMKVRLMQHAFRKLVLGAYDSHCCVTGNPVPELLVASHILPWHQFPKERLNPRNGLCLAAHFDRAFDRGLITFDEQLRLSLSPALRKRLPNPAIETEFCRREGRRLAVPERFEPNADFLRYHRESLFRS